MVFLQGRKWCLSARWRVGPGKSHSIQHFYCPWILEPPAAVPVCCNLRENAKCSLQASHCLTSLLFIFVPCSNTGLQEGKSTVLPPLQAGPAPWGAWWRERWLCLLLGMSSKVRGRPDVGTHSALAMPTAAFPFRQRRAAGGRFSAL